MSAATVIADEKIAPFQDGANLTNGSAADDDRVSGNRVRQLYRLFMLGRGAHDHNLDGTLPG
jgi:hypothetical protein